MVWLFACIFTLQIKKYILCLYIHPHLEKHPWICWWAGLECGPARPCGYFTLKIVCIYRHICTCMSVCLPVCLPVCLIYTYIYIPYGCRGGLCIGSQSWSHLVASMSIGKRATTAWNQAPKNATYVCIYIYMNFFQKTYIYACASMHVWVHCKKYAYTFTYIIYEYVSTSVSISIHLYKCLPHQLSLCAFKRHLDVEEH